MNRTTRIVTLTNEQATTLTMYLLMSTNHRKGEYETWLKLAQERSEDGSVRFPKAESNAKWWAETSATLEDVRKAVDDAPYVEEN